MADQSQILREYLIALGFQVNETEAKKFDSKLGDWDKKVNVLGKSLLGAGVAVATMVSVFAYQMDKLFFASRRTDAAASSIQALEYAGKRVGVGGDAMRSALEGMARAMRAQPGLQALIQSFGIPVKGRDQADVMRDVIKYLNQLPPSVAGQYANMFGIDPDTLYMIRQSGDEFERAIELRKQMAKDAGVDTDAAARAGHEYSNTWSEIIERVGLLKDAVSIRLLPEFQKMAKEVNSILIDLTKMVALPYDQMMDKLMSNLPSWEQFKERFFRMDNPDFVANGGVELSKESKKREGLPADAPTAQPTGRASARWVQNKYHAFMRAMGAKGYDSQDGDEASVDAAQDLSSFKKGGTGGSYSDYQVDPKTGKLVRKAGGGSSAPGKDLSDGDAVERTGLTKEEIAKYFEQLEKEYGLTPGTLDRIWKAESQRGNPQWMLSSKGAKGHFGLMPGTAKDLGVDDPNDFMSSAEGAAKYYAAQKKRFGDDRSAAAAYNWGPEKVDKFGLGKAPPETQDYMNKVAGGDTNINQTNHVTVNGVSDPQKAASEVGDAMQDANADIIRNQRVKTY